MKPIIKNISFALLFAATPLLAQEEQITVTNLKSVNSEFYEMHAIPFGDDLIITSTRNKEFMVCQDPELKGKRYADLYLSEGDKKEKYGAVQLIEGKLKTNYHDAVPSIHPDGKMMIFTRTYAYKPDSKILHLYSAKYVNGVWDEIKSLPFNVKEYSNLHPSWSPDGKELYFASHGSEGKTTTDLYAVSYMDGNWGTPKSLGDVINTKGIEYFPFMDNTGRLFFASDGHKGMGGLDIFYTEKAGTGWTTPEALPKPFNSKSDDHAFVSMPNNKMGFLSSNRKGGKGEDDIYIWKNEAKPIDIQIIVTNKETEIQLGEADVVIEPILERIPNSKYLDEESKSKVALVSKTKKPLTYTTVPSGFYKIIVNKEGFEPVEVIASSADLAAKEIFNIPLVPIRKYKTFDGVVINVQTLKPIADSKVSVLNKCTQKAENVLTDADGKFTAQIDLACDYEILATKDNFVEDQLLLTSSSFKSDNPNPITATLKLAPPVSKGLVITLDNIYYDLDKFYIRPDAAVELDKIVRLMQRYPSMEIELRSHTDVRGDDAYNMTLSQNRAESAVEYIITKGIARNRLKARGYGESAIVNQCSNGVKCSELEHQQNRRTEIKVTELKEEDVEIGYKN